MKINIEYLLGRKEIILSREHIQDQICNKKILITGAAGSIGRELARQIISYKPSQLCLIDQSELGIHDLRSELGGHSGIETELADITDPFKMSSIFSDFKPQLVFHAAAYKHVGLMENSPYQAIKNNIIGTKIIADLSLQNGVEKFIFISTDKAVNPLNNMGISKRTGELYVQSLNKKSTTQFIISRLGNILGSTGSVYAIFNEQIKTGRPVTVTSRKATRYFMTHFEASQFIIEAAVIGKAGEVLVFDMGSPILINELAKKMIKLEGLTIGKDIRIVITGLKNGEKIHESFVYDDEKLMPANHPGINIYCPEITHQIDINKKITMLSKALETEKPEQLSILLKNILPENKTAKILYLEPKFSQNNIFAEE